MNKTELYEQEKKIMFDKMNKIAPNWRDDRKVVNKVKAAAKQSAKNLGNALEIGQLAGVPAREVMRQAIMLHTVMPGSIEAAFGVIRHMVAQGKSWADVMTFVAAKCAHVPESKMKEVFYNDK
jgi:hypothetical protein